MSTLLALAIGALVGGVAGYAGGTVDDLLSRFTDFVLVLPAIYVALALRAVMPLVLPPATVFALLGGIFALLGWPIVARGVRAIVASERERDYAVAGHALGARPSRILLRHLLPAAGGYLGVQATLLLPAFILAEATLSYVGLGFPDDRADVGDDAAGRGERVAARRSAVDARARRRDLRRRPRREPRGAGNRPRACTIGAMTHALRGASFTPIVTPFQRRRHHRRRRRARATSRAG